MHRKVVGALAAVLALALASCGGSDVTKADFVKEANAACVKVRKDTEKVRGKGINAFADRIEAFAKSKAEAVEGVEPPDELRDTYTQFTDVLTQRSELISRLVVQVKARQRVSKQDEKTVADLQTRETRLASTLGIRSCGEGGDTGGGADRG